MGMRNQDCAKGFFGEQRNVGKRLGRHVKRHSSIDKQPLAGRFNFDAATTNFARATKDSNFHVDNYEPPWARRLSPEQLMFPLSA
jgi:hypothetical protein